MKVVNYLKRQFINLKFTLPIGVIVLSSLNQLTAFAVGGVYDQHLFATESIFAYNPGDTGCPAASDVGSVTQLSGKDNEQKIYNFWIADGLTPAQAAGITGSMQYEGGFSPFRQQDGQTWPDGNYGIANFSDDNGAGQRTAVTKFLAGSVGQDTFTKYYSSTYGAATLAAKGYVPDGIPSTPDVNGSFLLGELQYLATYVAGFSPSTIPERVSALNVDQNITIPSGSKLLDFIKTLKTTDNVAATWTYLYEHPSSDIKNATASRAHAADQALTQYAGGVSNSNCTSGSAVNCPASGVANTATTGDGSITAIVSTAKCITFQPPSGSKSSRSLGVAACIPGFSASPNHCNGPTAPPNYAAARRLYKTAGPAGTNDAYDNYGGDCGNFVSTVIRMSGADPTYPISGVSNMYNYMSAHSNKYQQIQTTSSTAKVEPGDILTEVGNGHIFLYIGDGYVAQASQGQEMPIQEPWFGMRVVDWRIKP